MKKKSLEELLKQDVKAIMKKGGLPQDVIDQEPDIESKTLVATLRRWASEPEINKLIKSMMIESIDTKVLGTDVMIVTINMGSVQGIKALDAAQKDLKRTEEFLEPHGHA